VSHVLVTIVDISEKVKLERALEQSRKHNESQLEMLTSLLHSNPELLREFILGSYECFNRINNLLRQPAKSQLALRDKASCIFREIHNFKGESAALGLDFFEKAAHQFEDTLTQMRANPDLGGNDFLSLTVQLENLISYTQQVEQLTEKLGHYALVSSTAANAPAMGSAADSVSYKTDVWAQLPEYVQKLAQRHGKQVKLVSSGLRDFDFDRKYQSQLKEICLQLIRNAVVHGIETPRDRELSEKPLQGRIDLRVAQISPTEIELSVMDDGQGLNYDLIRTKAIASGQWSVAEVESWSNKQLFSLIFTPGFSTATEVGLDAGRGVGMDLVMTNVQAHRGKITLASRPGRHCRFILTMPLILAQAEAAA
jgi:two-component system, chemotaxis family, sensor kinase CheA